MNNDSTLSYDQQPLTTEQVKKMKYKCFLPSIIFLLFCTIPFVFLCIFKPAGFSLNELYEVSKNPMLSVFVFLMIFTTYILVLLELEEYGTIGDSSYPELLELCQKYPELNEYRKSVITLGRPLLRFEFYQMKNWHKRKEFILLQNKNIEARKSFYTK